MKKVCIVGLGYVGLPLARQFVRGGVSVLGLDIDRSKIDTLTRGESFIRHIPASEIAEMNATGRFEATDDFSRVSGVDAVIICVPTPLSKHREPDLSFVISTATSIAPHLSRGTVVSLESTTYPGTTDGELRTALEKGSGLVAGVDFHLVYSPEREDPGNVKSVEKIPKLLGGLTDKCRDRAMEIYSTAIDSIEPVASCRVAEAAKFPVQLVAEHQIAIFFQVRVT